VSEASAWRCACGHPFDDRDERIRLLLRERQIHAWITLAALLVIGAVSAFGIAYAALEGFIVLSSLGFTALILLTARTVRTLRITRARLRRLRPRGAGMPRAIVHRR
jgi:hypothetical protein